MKVFVATVLASLCVVQIQGVAISSGYNCGNNNPCTAENIQDGNFYWAAEDPAKFVQCDEHGGCFVMPCGPCTEWSQEKQTCDHAPGGCDDGEEASEETAECVDSAEETEIMCENRGWVFLHCPRGTSIQINSASYGRTQSSREVCRYYWFHENRQDCVDPATELKVKDQCDGKCFCAVPATSRFFGDPCPNTYKYLTVTHQCVCDRPETFDCDANNPCTSDNIAENGHYYAHHDAANFVQCDDHGGCWVMPCGPGTEWNDDVKTCDHA